MTETATTTTILRATFTSLNPRAEALAFQIRLATERGYTSTLRTEGTAVVVVASDGQSVKFVHANDLVK